MLFKYFVWAGCIFNPRGDKVTAKCVGFKIQLILGCDLLLAFARNAQEMNSQHFRHPETQLSTAILSLKSRGWGWRVAALRLRKNSYLWKRCWNKGLVSEKTYILQDEVIHCCQRGWSFRRNRQRGFRLWDGLTKPIQNSLYASLGAKKGKLWITQDPLKLPLLWGLNKSNVFICKCLNGGKALNLFLSNTAYLATKNKTFRNWNDKQTAWTFKQYFIA